MWATAKTLPVAALSATIAAGVMRADAMRIAARKIEHPWARNGALADGGAGITPSIHSFGMSADERRQALPADPHCVEQGGRAPSTMAAPARDNR